MFTTYINGITTISNGSLLFIMWAIVSNAMHVSICVLLPELAPPIEKSFLHLCLCVICFEAINQIDMMVNYPACISIEKIEIHYTTEISNIINEIQLPKFHQSASPVAGFIGVSNVHECLVGFKWLWWLFASRHLAVNCHTTAN